MRDIQKINKIICRLTKYQDQAPYDLPALVEFKSQIDIACASLS